MLLHQLEEYRDHYRGCVFQIKNHNDEWITVQADNRDEDLFYFRELQVNNNVFMMGSVFTVRGETEVNISYPSLGLINTNTDVRYVTRAPTRQWRKAYRVEGQKFRKLDCTKQIEHQYTIRGRPSPLYTSGKYDITYYIFNNEYYTIQEALQMIEEGQRISVAINPRVAVSLNLFNVDNYTIYYKNYLVGLLDKETRVLKLLQTYEHLTNDLRFSLEPQDVELISYLSEEEVNEP